MTKRTHSVLAAVAVALMVGCEPQPEQPTASDEQVSTAQPLATSTAERPAAADPSPTSEAGAAKEGEDEAIVKIAEWDEIMKTVASSKKPAVLDVWSLVCQPCLEEFPGLVRLDKEMGDQVACFSADVDFDGRKTRPPESYRPRVEAFLQKVDAASAFPHFISATSSDDVYSELDIDSIPTVVVFNADGTIAKKFVDAGETAGFTYDDDVIPFVKSLLAQQ